MPISGKPEIGCVRAPQDEGGIRLVPQFRPMRSTRWP